MKAIFIYTRLIFCIIISAVLSNQMKAQSNPNLVDMKNVKDTIQKYDSLFWKAYNSCDLDQLRTFFTENLEFYHDKTGLTATQSGFIESIENGICSNKDWRLRREAVEGSVRVFPINNYGAIITGEHVFYVKEKNKNERPEGKAYFFHLWQFIDNTWKMSRVFSYDHTPITYREKKTAISLPVEILMQYVGNYKSPQAGIATITKETEYLFLQSGGFQEAIYPESEDNFFLKEKNIQFKFIRDGNGQVIKMVIFENGTAVDEAERIN